MPKNILRQILKLQNENEKENVISLESIYYHFNFSTWGGFNKLSEN